MDEILIVKTFDSQIEAELAKSMLSARGIYATIEADDEDGLAPFLLETTLGAKLLIHSKDLRKAAEILEKEPQ